jgi:hypothetical protein
LKSFVTEHFHERVYNDGFWKSQFLVVIAMTCFTTRINNGCHMWQRSFFLAEVISSDISSHKKREF